MLAIGRHYRTAFALFPVLHANLSAILPRAHPQAQRFLVVKLHPIGAGVDVAAVRIAVDQPAPGSKVAPAVVFMKAQRRKFEKIDVVTLQYVFEERRYTDLSRRDGLRRAHLARRQPK